MALSPLLAVGAMLVALPIVVVQGPAHTTPLDAINLLFLGVYSCHLLARRTRLAFPLLLPFWLLLLGSCGGLYSATDLGSGLITIAQDVYLYLWFVVLAHFVLHHCRPDAVLTLWASVAAALTLVTLLDVHAGLLGARLAGEQRAVGTFIEPNMFGNYLVVSFFLTWAAAAAGRRLLYPVLLLLGAGVHATASNGSLVGLAGGCGVVVAVSLFRDWRRAVGPLLAAAALALAVVGTGWEQVSTLGVDIASRERGAVGGAALKGYAGRTAIWSDIDDIVREAPMGVGPGNLGAVRGARSGDYHSAHNTYLGMLVERGPLGLAGWCGMLLGVATWLRRWRPADAGLSLASAPLWGLLAAIVLHGTVIELSHFRHVWLAIAMLWAITRLTAIVPARARTPTLDVGFRPAVLESA